MAAIKRTTHNPDANRADLATGERAPLGCLRPVMMALSLAGLTGFPVQAKEYFNPAFLDNGSGAPVDLSSYESAGVVPEGDYLVDVYMNQMQAFTRSMHFVKNDKGEVLPEVTPAQLKSAGVAIDRLDGLKGLAPDAVIKDLRAAVPGATVKFNLSKLRLDLTVPQVNMLVQADGTVDPSLWDEGVPGMVFSYMGSANRTKTDGYDGMDGSHSDSLFGSANGGANLGPWRLRSSFSYSQYTSSGQGYDSSSQNSQFSNTYVQRDVQALRAEIYAGEKSTGSNVFAESIPFRGVQLVSEDSMLPTSQRGFSPTVSGIANSTAKVSVRQNGNLVYETTVPPGPFRLTDINAGGSGELETTVTEADGSKHISTQYFSTVGDMKSPGAVDWEVSSGKYHGSSAYEGSRDPLFGMATARVGLPGALTLYGGLLMAQKYQSAVTGLAVSLGVIGAITLDATLAQAKVSTTGGGDGPDGQPGPEDNKDSRENGVAWRMQYARSLDTTGTSLNVTGTRYSEHYMSFQDTATRGYNLSDDQAPWLRERRRNSWQVSLNQTLGWIGSVFVNASQNDYWSSSQVVKSVGAGFSSSIKGVSYSVNYNEDRTQTHASSSDWPTNRQVSVNVSVPFSLFNPQWQAVRDTYVNYNMTHDNQGRTSQQTGVNGSLVDNKLSWSASQSHDNQGGGTSGNAGLGWSGDKLSSSMNYGYGANTQSFGASASGGLVVHPHGLTLTRSASPDGAIAVVEAPGAGDVKVGGTATDGRGYAVSPYLQPYQRNSVSLDTTTLPDGVDIPQSSVVVYPTKGAIVEAKFKTRVGRQAMLTLNHQGKPVPFGAMVSLPTDDAMSAAIVGDDGMVYLTGAPQKGTLQVQWGSGPDQQCQVRYDLGELPKIDKDAPNATAMGIVQKTLVCQSASGSAIAATDMPKPAASEGASTISQAGVSPMNGTPASDGLTGAAGGVPALPAMTPAQTAGAKK